MDEQPLIWKINRLKDNKRKGKITDTSVYKALNPILLRDLNKKF